MQKIYDFSSAGSKAAIVEFLVSLVKSVGVVAVGVIAAKLSGYHVPVDSAHADLFTAALVLARSVVSAVSVWINSLPGEAVSPNSGLNQVSDIVA